MTDKIGSYIILLSLCLFLLPVAKTITLAVFGTGLILLITTADRVNIALLGIVVFITTIALNIRLPLPSTHPPLIRFMEALALWSGLLLLLLFFWSKYKRKVTQQNDT